MATNMAERCEFSGKELPTDMRGDGFWASSKESARRDLHRLPRQVVAPVLTASVPDAVGAPAYYKRKGASELPLVEDPLFGNPASEYAHRAVSQFRRVRRAPLTQPLVRQLDPGPLR
jgi:hypothetical protein